MTRGARPRSLVNPYPVLARMEAEARRSEHGHLGSEQFALVALDGPGGLEMIAAAAGLDPSVLRPALESCCSNRNAGGGSILPVTPNTAALLAGAAQFALADGAASIEPRHLVSALLLLPNLTAWSALRGLGLDPARVRELAESLPLAAAVPAGSAAPN